jgi:hypothetical protein
LAEEEWEYRVRHRAYELWNAAGRPDGKHLEFWEAAERELKTQAKTSANGLDTLDLGSGSGKANGQH